MYHRVGDLLRRGERFLVTMHRRPDGDALGSSLALANALRERGKEVVHYNPDPAPYNLRFLTGSEQIVPLVEPDATFDATLVCDTGRLDHLGPSFPAEPRRRGILVRLDHHPDPDEHPLGADLDLVDPQGAAVGVLVYRLLVGLGHPLSRAVAEPLYAAILTDTGSFRYDSTDPEALAVTGELVAAGVRPWNMASRIYESNPVCRVRLLAETLRTLEIAHDGRFATLTVTRAMLTTCGATEVMLDGFVNHARAIDGVEVGGLFVEQPDGRFKLSLRSRGNVDLAPLPTHLGGKGTPNAASAVLTGDLTAAKDRAARAVGALLGLPDSAVA